jgi:carbon starvation protein
MIERETDARVVGYGGMLMESFVGVMALIAACTLDPGVYFAMNATPAAVQQASATLSSAGFVVTPDQMSALASQMGEESLTGRTGGAPSLAVGIAQIFAGASSVFGASGLTALWYHFAIMFEALFILTTIDTGTRVGRFMLQEILAHASPQLGRTSWYPGIVLTSFMVVAGWGYFLYQGVVDPLGGINSLWPLFGISNQLLATVALCVGTTVIIKSGRARFAWVTGAPLVWLLTVTMTAGTQKIFSSDPDLGFLAHARSLVGSVDPNAARRIFNDRLNATIALVFMVTVGLVVLASLWEWWRVFRARQPARETSVGYAS